MNTVNKQIIKSTFLPLMANRLSQSFYELLYRISLLGMNIGGGSLVANSGELSVLHLAAKVFIKKSSLVVLDVGANYGDWTVAAALVFGDKARFYCFEPSAETRETLVRNLASVGHVLVLPLGVSDVPETRRLFRPAESGCASLYDRGSHTDLVERTKVVENIELVRIDEFCATRGIDVIDFIKMDIEGHELAALSGCGDMLKKGRIRYLQFEFGGCNIDSRTYFHDFWKLLSPQYRIFRVLPRGLREIRKYHETLEVFTTTNFVAVVKNIDC